MTRQTPESLMLSGVLNSQDPATLSDSGITAEHLFGHRDEFEWIDSYVRMFNRVPTKAEFTAVFPDFTVDAEQSDVHWPAHEVRRQYAARQLSRALLKASGALKAGQIEDAYGFLSGLELNTSVSRPTNLLLDPHYLDDYDKPEDRVAVPWPTVHQHTDGIARGELWYFAARQGQGKSQNLLEIAADAAMRGQRSIIYSLEMTKRQTQTRAHAIIAKKLGIKISHHAMRTRMFDALEYKKLLARIAEEVPGEILIHTPADGPTNPSTIKARADEFDLNIIDYIGLMTNDAGQPAVDDWRIEAGISNALKQITLAKSARIISAAQINREGATDNGRPPKLKTISGTDAIGKDGDVVITMARYSQTAAMCSIEKNRNGASGVYYFTRFDADRGDYHEITRDEANDLRDNEYQE